jgi:hypothetical protein
MITIHLISTRHEPLGKCTSLNLLHIFREINPEIIFEEMPPSNFDIYYKEVERSNLESEAIRSYLKEKSFMHIPIDLDETPNEEFFKKFKLLSNKIEGLPSRSGFDYRNLMDRNSFCIGSQGFTYMNSQLCSDYYTAIKNTIEEALNELEDEKLFNIYNSWESWNNLREEKMLSNIYEFTQHNKYERAIFLLGAAHRPSIIEKITQLQDKNESEIEWILELNA